jgi:predicted CDP-diglyceride synthetase/phosphatidate cytidylyltransferase
LKTERTRISPKDPTKMPVTEIHEIILMALVDFLALKYRQAKRNLNVECLFIVVMIVRRFLAFDFFEQCLHFINIIQ